MQLGGIGNSHSSDMHHVTNCMHNHDSDRLQGAVKMASSSEAPKQEMRVSQEQTQLSFMDWVQRLLRNGRQRLLGLWRGNDTPVQGEPGDKTGTSQVMAQVGGESDTSVKRHQDALHSNRYFAAIEPERTPGTAVPVFQKVKLKTKAVTGQLAKHLPGRFFNFQKQGSFHAKKEGRREDLRKRSKYRQDQLEIDCVLTDESYLLDSYDRKGEYRQLTTRK